MRNPAKWCALLYLAVLYGTWAATVEGFASLYRIVGLALFFVWGVSVFIHKSLRRPPAFLLAIFAYFAWASLTCFWAIDPVDAGVAIYRTALTIGMCAVCLDLFRTSRDADLATRAVILAAYLPVANTVRMYLAGTAKSYDRFTDGSFDPNILAMSLAMIIPVAWGIAISPKKQPLWFRVVCYLYPVAALAGIVLSASRGGLVCAVPALIYMVVTALRASRGARIALAVLACAAVIGASQMDLSNQLTRLSSVVTSASTDGFTGRIDVWRAGWDVFSHNSFVGVGIGNFPRSTAGYEGLERSPTGEPLVAHNAYLSIATETGIVGFLLFLTALAFVVAACWKLPPVERTPWLVALGVWAIGACSITAEQAPQTWVLLMLAVVNATAQRNEEAPIKRVYREIQVPANAPII